MEFYDKYDDKRSQNGIGSQMNVWDSSLKKYVLLIPLESVPSVVGGSNSVDVDLLTSDMITKIKGKSTIDDKDQEFLWHRDNILRLSKFVGKQCKFLNSYPDGTGMLYEGEITYRVNDASSDKLTGTMTIIANKVVSEPVMDVRDLMARTCFVTSIVPKSLKVATTNASGEVVDLASNIAGVTFTAESDNEAITATITEASGSNSAFVTIKGTAAGYGIVTIKSTKAGHGSWETTIAVEVE